MGVLGNTVVNELYDIGADASTNLYDIYITPPTALLEDTEKRKKAFRLRTEGFTPPTFKQEKQQVVYQTLTIDRPSSKITGERSFTLTFRMDAYYQVYQDLLRWQSAWMTADTGRVGLELDDDFLGKIEVVALATPPSFKSSKPFEFDGVTSGDLKNLLDEDTLRWEFRDVWISDVTEPTFSAGDSSRQTVSATFNFGYFNSPLSKRQYKSDFSN